MVNEVLPREELIARAYAIADHIMTQPRTVRRLTTQIVRRPWKQRIVADLDGGFGIQMFGHIAKKRAVHGQEAHPQHRRLRPRGPQEQLRLIETKPCRPHRRPYPPGSGLAGGPGARREPARAVADVG